jgi:hypothetical protein
MLTILEQYNKKKSIYFTCKCECGNIKDIRKDSIIGPRAETKSCGCYAAEFRAALIKTADEERRNYTHKSHAAMLARCYNPKAPSYAKYGGSGITVCDRWRFGENGKTGWLCFFEDMGPKPTGHSIDKIDNTKGYSPDNCRWATQQEQNANRRPWGSVNGRRPLPK